MDWTEVGLVEEVAFAQWDRGTVSVEIGAVVQDNGPSLMVLFRAYNVTP
ncbi:hypothetical protein [Lentzea aerocolonigenes]|nr:hypothetical protein [Lentzea aerocolonigenes]